MADETTTDTATPETTSAPDQPQKKGATGQSLLQQVHADVKKAAADKVKNELKELVKQKLENQKAGAIIDEKINKIISDFDAGLT